MKTLNLLATVLVATLGANSFSATADEIPELPPVGTVIYTGPLQGGTICDTLDEARALVHTEVGSPLPPTCGTLVRPLLGMATIVEIVDNFRGITILCRYDMPGSPIPVQFGPWITYPVDPGQPA